MYRQDAAAQNPARFAPAEIRRAEGNIPITALEGVTLDLDFIAALRDQEALRED